jgi:hypothetical protein
VPISDVQKRRALTMASLKKTVIDSRKLRELTEKELNEIMKAVGERVRAQTVELKARIKTSLRKEIDSARAGFFSDDKKNP